MFSQQGLKFRAVQMQVAPQWYSLDVRSEAWLSDTRETMASLTCGCTVHILGGNTVTYDQAHALYSNTAVLMGCTVLGVVVVSLVAFRSLLLSARLMLTVAVTLAWVGGLCQLVFQTWLGCTGMYYLVPICTTPVVVGLTIDYDLFLISRIREQRLQGYSTRDSVVSGLGKTGGIITSAGVIMICAFSSMLMAKERVLQQFGFVLCAASFLDCFVVRPFLVPALMLVLEGYNWWPFVMPPVTERIATSDEELHENGLELVEDGL